MKEQNYFPTLSETIKEAILRGEKKGFKVIENTFTWPHVPYEQTIKVSLELEKNEKIQKKMLHISIYRMASGNYELTTYIN